MPENLQQNPWFQLILVAVIAVAIVWGGKTVWPNTTEMKTTISGLEDRISTLNQEVKELQRLEKMLPELRAKIRAMEKELETLKKIIPTEGEADDLIRKLERMAAETDMTVSSFNPGGREQKEFYYEWPINLAAEGTYHNLGKFFAKISNFARIINVRQVTINSASRGSTSTIHAQFTAVTYIYKEDEDS